MNTNGKYLAQLTVKTRLANLKYEIHKRKSKLGIIYIYAFSLFDARVKIALKSSREKNN